MLDNEFSPYRAFSADEWGNLRQGAEMTLTEAELESLRGLGETISLAEAEEIYLPLSRLLSLYVEATQTLYGATNEFLGRETKVPFIIGVAGSVAVGKSTTSRILREMLARWPSHPTVELITTDGFLFPNQVLQERGLMERKGFPESFDLKRLRGFLADIKSGRTAAEAPVYSHIAYDILPEEKIRISRPDILIVEGLNVLQPAVLAKEGTEIPLFPTISISRFILMPKPRLCSAGMSSALWGCAKPPFARPALILNAMQSLTMKQRKRRRLIFGRALI